MMNTNIFNANRWNSIHFDIYSPATSTRINDVRISKVAAKYGKTIICIKLRTTHWNNINKQSRMSPVLLKSIVMSFGCNWRWWCCEYHCIQHFKNAIKITISDFFWKYCLSCVASCVWVELFTLLFQNFVILCTYTVV